MAEPIKYTAVKAEMTLVAVAPVPYDHELK